MTVKSCLDVAMMKVTAGGSYEQLPTRESPSLASGAETVHQFCLLSTVQRDGVGTCTVTTALNGMCDLNADGCVSTNAKYQQLEMRLARS